MVALPLRAQYYLDNPDPDGNYIIKFEFTQLVPAGDANDPARKLPGRDTYLLPPDRTGCVEISVDLTFTHTALNVYFIDAMGAVMDSATSVSSGGAITLSGSPVKYTAPFHVIVKKPSGGNAIAVKTIVIPENANQPDRPLFVGGSSPGVPGGGPSGTPPPPHPTFEATGGGNESAASGESYGSCTSCSGACPTAPPPVTETQEESDLTGATPASGPAGSGLAHNTQSAGTSDGGMSSTSLGFDVPIASGISRADFKVNGSGGATITEDTVGITSITTGSLYTKVETVTAPVAGVKVSQWRTAALATSDPNNPLRVSLYKNTATNEITKTTTIDGHGVDTVWRYSNTGPTWELVMGNGLRKKVITLESNMDTSLRVERQKLYERAAGATGEAAVLVSDVCVTYKRYSFAWKKVKEEVYGTSGNPLTTVWEYWGASDVTGSGGSINGQGLIKHVARPGGWTRDYTYSFASGPNVAGRIATSPFTGTAGGWVESVSVASSWSSRVLAISGNTVESEMHTWTGDTLTEQVTSAESTLETVTTINTLGSDFGGLPTEIEYPDGTGLTATYSRGGDGSTLVTWAEGEYDSGAIVDGTQTELSTDAVGFRSGVLKYDLLSSVTLEEALVTDTEKWGRPASIEYFGDPQLTESYVYNCCGLESSTDRTGLVTYYAHDDVHRLVKTNSAGVSLQTVYDGLEIRTYRSSEATMSAPGTPSAGNQVSASSRDLRGSVGTQQRRSPDSGNMITYATSTTVYLTDGASLPSGTGKKTTRTLAGGGSPQETTWSYFDGRPYETTGNLGTNLRYSYAIASYDTNWNGTTDTPLLTTTTTRLNGGTAMEYATRTADQSGRTLAESSFGNGATRYRYHASGTGQMVKSQDADGVVHLYEYNNLGDRVLSVLDVNGNGNVDYGSDQVSFTETRPDSGVIRTVSKVWQPGAGSGSPTVVSIADRSPDGLSSAQERFEAIGGIVSGSETILSATPDGNWRTEATHEDQTISVAYYVAGRLVAETLWASGSTPPGTAPANIMSVGTSGFVHGTAYHHDGYGRVDIVTDSRTGAVTSTYKSTVCDYVISVEDAGGRITGYAYDDRGRRITVNQPDTDDPAAVPDYDNVVTTTYYPDDSVYQVSGDTYQTEYTYDYANRMLTMKTFGSVTATTTWDYDANGRLEQKFYPDGPDVDSAADPGPSYTYTAAGRLKKRIWASGKTTRYDYDDGRLVARRYFTSATSQSSVDSASTGNDSTTPDIVYTLDALGRTTSVTRGGATHFTYTYDSGDLGVLTEAQDDILFQPRKLTRKRDAKLRSAGYKFGTTADDDAVSEVTYGYDSAGRFSSLTYQRVPGGGAPAAQTFTYGYDYQASGGYHVAGSGSPSLTPFSMTGPAHKAKRSYETTRGALHSIRNEKLSSTLQSEYLYTVNALGQRTQVDEDGGAFTSISGDSPDVQDWTYNDKGELRSTNSGVTANDRYFEYDGIGNRTLARIWTTTSSGGFPTSYYGTTGTTSPGGDALNQYERIDNYFAGTSYPVHDADGNLTDDGQEWTYEWDGENRMISATPRTISKGKVVYSYDHLGRLVDSIGYYWNAGTSAWVATGTNWRYVYDGWNRIESWVSYTNFRNEYVWGLDLSGSRQGAGGVGGMLLWSASQDTGSTWQSYYPCYDGNGNIGQLLDSSGNVAAHWEYDAYGQITQHTPYTYANGPVDIFDFGFSTKPRMHTGLYYYGYRFYDPVTGRWPSRDPIGERGGLNLFGFLDNRPLDVSDYLGMGFWSKTGKGSGVGTIVWLIYVNVETRVTCGECECKALWYEISKNAQTLKGLQRIREESEGRADPDKHNGNSAPEFIQIPDYEGDGTLGGVGILNNDDWDALKLIGGCPENENAEFLKDVRSNFEWRPKASALTEGGMRIMNKKLEEDGGELPAENASKYSRTMIDRQEDYQKYLLELYGEECYDY